MLYGSPVKISKEGYLEAVILNRGNAVARTEAVLPNEQEADKGCTEARRGQSLLRRRKGPIEIRGHEL